MSFLFLSTLLPLSVGVLWEQYTFYSFICLQLFWWHLASFKLPYEVRQPQISGIGKIKLALEEVAADGKMPWLTFSFSFKNFFWHFTASWQTVSSPYLRKCGAELNKGCLCTGAEKCIICKLVGNSVPSFLATKPVQKQHKCHQILVSKTKTKAKTKMELN